MYAIETKHRGATNSRGSRIHVAIADGRKLTAHCPASMTLPYDHALSTAENHRAAATALLSVVHPRGVWVAGETKTGYTYCNVPGTNEEPLRVTL